MNGDWVQFPFASAVRDSAVGIIASREGRAAIAALCCCASLWCLLSGAKRFQQLAGSILGLIGLVLLWSLVAQINHVTQSAAFYAMSGLAIGSAIATISARSPVYSAIWFAASLVGTGGLFLLQGAQFLAIATVAVYAGAIVVTFLFVLMLAQPEGHTFYDRISWGRWGRFVGPICAASLVAIGGLSFGRLADSRHERLWNSIQRFLDESAGGAANVHITQVRVRTLAEDAVRIQIDYVAARSVHPEIEKLAAALSNDVTRSHAEVKSCEVEFRPASGVQSADHVANLGAELFGRHLIAVQAAGCMLMAALVGALAIATHGSGPTKATGISSP
jgi:NADH-quinone oxidoreductase subunit J